jgi:hypothetical protein
MITIRLLHALSGAIPGLSWWRKKGDRLIKTGTFEGVGVAISAWRSRRLHSNQDKEAPDMELGILSRGGC